MTKQKHFYLIRGLIREKGHWGTFPDELQARFPDALISTIEIPGAGDYHKGVTPLTIAEMVEQMRLDFLKFKAPSEESYLVAISLGGMIAVEWMKKHPADFVHASLINTSFGNVSPVFHRFKPSAFFFLLKVPILKGRAKEERILRLVTNDQKIFDTTLNTWEEVQKLRPVSFKNGMRQLFAAARFKVKDFTPPIPLQIITATHDRMVDAECSRSIARKWKIPLKEHPTAGHDLTVDDPKWVAEKVFEGITGS